MKISELIEKERKASAHDVLPPLQKKVLGFFEQHKDEVFTYSDSVMLDALKNEKETAINWSVWSLEQKGFLAKIKVGRKTYFGLPEDVNKFKSALVKLENKNKSS